MSFLLEAGKSMLPQTMGSVASGIGNSNSFLNSFSSLASKLFSGNNLANAGNLLGGAGALYGAYNGKKLGDEQMDLVKQQNQLLLDKYDDDKRRRESQDKSFASVWG